MSIARPHALIVEDHSTSALALKSALSVMGYATFGLASTGHQAVMAAKARKPLAAIYDQATAKKPPVGCEARSMGRPSKAREPGSTRSPVATTNVPSGCLPRWARRKSETGT